MVNHAYNAIDHQDIKYCPPCDDSRSDDLPSDSGVAAGDAHGVIDEGGGGLAGEQLLHPEVGRQGGHLQRGYEVWKGGPPARRSSGKERRDP